MTRANKRSSGVRSALLFALLSGLVARAGCPAQAQGSGPTLRQLHHRAWSIRDGAPSGVASIVQSSDGFLWIGSRTGLYRFDGMRFEHFDPPSGTSMPSLVNMLLALPDGSLWIGYAFGGASVLAGGRLVNYTERDGLPRGTVTAFARDSDGTVWAATTTGLARLVRGRWQRVGAELGFPGGLTADLLVDRRGTLWASEISGVYVLRRGARGFVRWAPSLDKSPGGSGMPREASDGSVWGASLSRGLVRLSDAAGGQLSSEALAYHDSGWSGLLVDRGAHAWLIGQFFALVRVPLPATGAGSGPPAPAKPETLTFSRAAGMSGDLPSSVLEDREGNVWVGTEGGVDQFRATKLTPVTWPRPIYLPAIAAGDSSALWVASWSTPVMAIRNRGDDRLVAAPEVTPPITCAYRDLEGDVWLGGPSGLWQLHGDTRARVALPTEATGTEIQAVARDRDGTLWLAARGRGTFRRRKGTWERFATPPGIDEQGAITVVADSAGRVWVGYPHSRLARVAGDVAQVYAEADGLSVGNVTAVSVHGKHVWVGGEHGVALLDDVGGVGQRRAPGAPFRPLVVAAEPLRGVTGIIETGAGDLWLNGANGVTRVPAAEVAHAIGDSASTARAERFDFRDGLDGTATQMRPLPSAVQATDGRLWFSTERGVVSVDPARLRRNSIAPPVQIRVVSAAGQGYAATDSHVALPKRTTEVQIEYTALSLSVSERVRFRYRLIGKSAGWRDVSSHDATWQDAGARREAIYTNLAPGTYHFQVAATNDDGVWNDQGASIDLVIPPTFVQTNAFFALCVLAAAAAIWLVLQWRQRQAARALRAHFEATLAERTRIAQELHDTLLQGFSGVTAQLYAVRRLLASRPTEAARTLANAVATADSTLREARHAVWEMRSPELTERDLPDAVAAASRDALAATPIDLQLNVRGDRRPLPREIEVTAFRICREAVTNAAKHANARSVALDMEYGPRALTVTVSDDGCGIVPSVVDSAAHDGHWGVVGMRERATHAGGTLDIAAAPGGGTRVTLSLPLDDERRDGDDERRGVPPIAPRSRPPSGW